MDRLIQFTVTECLGQVLALNIGLLVHIGNASGDAQNAVVGTVR